MMAESDHSDSSFTLDNDWTLVDQDGQIMNNDQASLLEDVKDKQVVDEQEITSGNASSENHEGEIQNRNETVPNVVNEDDSLDTNENLHSHQSLIGELVHDIADTDENLFEAQEAIVQPENAVENIKPLELNKIQEGSMEDNFTGNNTEDMNNLIGGGADSESDSDYIRIDTLDVEDEGDMNENDDDEFRQITSSSLTVTSSEVSSEVLQSEYCFLGQDIRRRYIDFGGNSDTESDISFCSNPEEELNTIESTDKNKNPCLKQYRHAQNDHLNYNLNVAMLLTFTAVVFLGIGHFLGSNQVENSLYEEQFKTHLLKETYRRAENVKQNCQSFELEPLKPVAAEESRQFLDDKQHLPPKQDASTETPKREEAVLDNFDNKKSVNYLADLNSPEDFNNSKMKEDQPESHKVILNNSKAVKNVKSDDNKELIDTSVRQNLSGQSNEIPNESVPISKQERLSLDHEEDRINIEEETVDNNSLFSSFFVSVGKQWDRVVNLTENDQFRNYYNSTKIGFSMIKDSMKSHWQNFKNFTQSEELQDYINYTKDGVIAWKESMFEGLETVHNLTHETVKVNLMKLDNFTKSEEFAEYVKSGKDTLTNMSRSVHHNWEKVKNSTTPDKLKRYMKKTASAVTSIGGALKETWYQVQNYTSESLEQGNMSFARVRESFSSNLEKVKKDVASKWEEIKFNMNDTSWLHKNNKKKANVKKRPQERNFQNESFASAAEKLIKRGGVEEGQEVSAQRNSENTDNKSIKKKKNSQQTNKKKNVNKKEKKVKNTNDQEKKKPDQQSNKKKNVSNKEKKKLNNNKKEKKKKNISNKEMKDDQNEDLKKKNNHQVNKKKNFSNQKKNKNKKEGKNVSSDVKDHVAKDKKKNEKKGKKQKEDKHDNSNNYNKDHGNNDQDKTFKNKKQFKTWSRKHTFDGHQNRHKGQPRHSNHDDHHDHLHMQFGWEHDPHHHSFEDVKFQEFEDHEQEIWHSCPWQLDDVEDLVFMQCDWDQECLKEQQRGAQKLYLELSTYWESLGDNGLHRKAKKMRKFLGSLETFVGKLPPTEEEFEEMLDDFADVLEDIERKSCEQWLLLNYEFANHHRDENESDDDTSTFIDDDDDDLNRAEWKDDPLTMQKKSGDWYLNRANYRREQSQAQWPYSDEVLNWYLLRGQERSDMRTGITVWDMYNWLTERYDHRDQWRGNHDVGSLWFLRKP